MNLRTFLWLLFATCLYFLAARAGMLVLSLQPNNITLLWLPSGIGLLMCIKVGWKGIPFVALASFASNVEGMMTISTHLALLHTFFISCSDSGASFLAAYLLKQRLPKGVKTVNSLFYFCLYACLIPCTLSSIALGVNLASGSYIPWSEITGFIFKLIAADSLGVLLIYPLYFVWAGEKTASHKISTSILIPSLITLALIVLAFTVAPAAIYLALAIMVYLSYQKKEPYVLALMLIAIVMILAFAAKDLGPFNLPNHNESIIALIAFAFTMTLIPLSIIFHTRELHRATDERDDWMKRANHDQLTGLTNRHGLFPNLRDEYRRVKRHRRPFVIAMIDIDHFKLINDKFGHHTGDVVLKYFADMMVNNIRETDLPVRYGGEEFIILLPETSLNSAILVLDDLRALCAKTGVTVKGQHINVTISLGAVEYTGGNETIDDLIKLADQRLYQAKKNGRNKLVAGALHSVVSRARDKPSTISSSDYGL